MKPTHDLFDLVHSLTKSEKRFFKLQSSLQAGEKNYVRLFDLLEKQKIYNPDKILQESKYVNESMIQYLVNVGFLVTSKIYFKRVRFPFCWNLWNK